MATSERLDTLERDRRDADQRYNAALTALDRAIVDLGSRDELTRHDLQHVGSLLLLFLQQITLYIDTKVRLASAAAEVRFDANEGALETLRGLQGDVALLHRAVQSLKRERPAAGGPVAPPEDRPAVTSSAADMGQDDFTYLGFEDRFRGSDEEIREKLRTYLALFTGRSSVLDVGCGRGEFLALLREQGVPARGIDINREMVAVARDRGFDVAQLDALTYLRSIPNGSLDGLMAAQVVEHLEPAYLIRLLETAYDKLEPDAPLVVETINPACWLAFFSSYIRDFTHVRPIHPDTLQYLLQACGFSRISVRYSSPVSEQLRMKAVELAPEIVGSAEPGARAIVQAARVINANATILNNLLFTYLDYAAIGYRS